MDLPIIQPRWLNLDQDGVFADWNKHFSAGGVSNEYFRDKPSQELWDYFVKRFDGGVGFYRSIPPFEGSKEFFDAVVALAEEKGLKVRTLTALIKLADIPNVHQEKIEWNIEHLDSDHTVEVGPLSEDKHLWCNPGDILIDDRKLNIEQWREKGGIGILHTSFEQSLKELREVLQ